MNKDLKNELMKEFQARFPAREFIPGQSPIPVSGKIFDEKEMLKITEAALDGWWTEGRMNKEFEEKLAEYIGMKFCSSVNSGSSANLLALAALASHLLGEKRIKPGDEVITLAAGFPTTINPIIQAGCVPVFVDIELETLSIDVEELKKAISKKTKAVMIAHTLGNPFDIDEVKKICKEHNLWLIEDNCDGLGSMYKGKRTGSFGDISTLSFYPAHHITTAEGGAVLTNDPILHKAVRSIRDWGRDCWCPTGHDDTCKNRFNWQLGKLPRGYDHKYVYSHIGYNLKMTEMQSALGLAQLEKLEGFVEKRKENFNSLREGLKKFNEYFDIVEPAKGSDPSWFGMLITLKTNEFSREDLLKYLNSKKIGTRLLFAGNATKQPYFLNYEIGHRIVGDLKNTDYVMNNTFWIGVYPGINQKMIQYVVESFGEFINKKLKFSIVVPVYNMADTISETIASALNQSYQNFEIIVQDNDSTDNTAQVVKSFKDPRIRYFKNECNLGAPRNFIEGWKNCRGDILYYLAADDIMAKNALLETSAAFLMDENIGAVTRPYFWFKEDINIPVRVTPRLNSSQDKIIRMNNFSKAAIVIHNEILGQVSGLAFRMKYLKESFFSPDDPWITHGYPFLNIFKNHPVVMLKNYQIAVRIGSSGIRIKNSPAYDVSPTKRWIDLLDKTLNEEKCRGFKNYYIKNIIAPNFIGLVQIRCYARLRFFFRELWYHVKYKWINILDLKFWFFALGCLVVPRTFLSKMADWYKNEINSRMIKKINFQYDINLK